MNCRIRTAAVFFASLSLTFAADSLPDGVQIKKSDAGKEILADGKGMALYTFDKDSDGKSDCNGKCAINWPPLMAASDAKPVEAWTIVTRDDGSKQWAHNGKPLYTWIKDTKAGQTSGDAVGGVWHLALP